MVVDDNPTNLVILEGMLIDRGHQVRAFATGQEALESAEKDPPELILLDIAMPQMTGFELCGRLKSDPKLSGVPVIFISAYNETKDKVKAFELGGVDYITKPFQLEEVEARVETHLVLRHQRLLLEESYHKLQGLEVLRDKLVGMIVHDMRSPLAAIQMTFELLEEAMSEENPNLGLVRIGRNSAGSLMEMATQLLDVSRFEHGEMPLKPVRTDLVGLARESLDAHRLLAGNRTLEVVSAVAVEANCDPDVIRRTLGNLIGNAIKFTPSNGLIRVDVQLEEGSAHVYVTDNGAGVPVEHHHRIFEKFGQVETKQRKLGTGLGLTFCKLAVEAHHGRIGVQSQPGKGSTFWFTLPLTG